MKKWLFFISISVLFIINPCKSQNNSDFEGVIIYDMEMEDVGMDPTSASTFDNLQTKTYIKGHESRSEIKSDFGNNVTITDSKKKISIILLDIMGMKFSISSNFEQAQNNEIVIKYTDEKKLIAGYTCKKAELIDPKEGSISVFYTEEIPISIYDTRFIGLKGFPLEYEVNQFGLKMIVTAKEVNKEAVNSTLFDIPEGYRPTTQQELIKMVEGKRE